MTDYLSIYWPEISTGTEAERKAAVTKLIERVKGRSYAEGYQAGADMAIAVFRNPFAAQPAHTVSELTPA